MGFRLESASCFRSKAVDTLAIDFMARSKVCVLLFTTLVGATGCPTRPLIEPDGGFPDDDTGGPPIPSECVDAVYGALGSRLSGNSNAAMTIGPSASCVEMSGPDSSVFFEAPRTARYRFDTSGSAIDTVLEVLEGDCDGPSLGCHDDISPPEVLTSRVEVNLQAGQVVTVVVDSYSQGGEWTLTVTDLSGPPPGMCDVDESLDTAPLRLAETLAGSNSNLISSCGGAGPEFVLSWTPPVTARYSFDVLLPEFDSVLYLYEDDSCQSEIACNADLGAINGAGFIQEVAGGRPVTVVVDSEDGSVGDFSLEIREVPGSCSNDAVFIEVPGVIEGATDMGRNSGGVSCGGDFAPDQTWRFIAPFSAVYTINIEAEFVWVVGLWDATCRQEFACTSSRSDDPSLVVELFEGQEMVLQVDALGHARGPYVAIIEAMGDVSCPNINLDSFLPISESGVLTRASDNAFPFCATGGTDVTYGFVAPADGLYEINTFGSTIDTVLSVWDGGCGGTQLGCNDDARNVESRVVVELFAGQFVVIAIDGFEGAVGEYVLNIDFG